MALARATEALFCGIAAALLTLAAASLSGASLSFLAAGGGSWSAALLAGSCASASWWWEKRPRKPSVARSVDARLMLDGALTAAFEATQRDSPSPVARLLDRRLCQRLRTGSVVRAALPTSMPFLVLPLVAAAALALVLDSRMPHTNEFDALAPLVNELAQEMGLARAAALQAARAGELSSEELSDLAALEAKARDLAFQVNSGRAGEEARAEIEDALLELSEDLAREARRQPPGEPLAEALERAADLAGAGTLTHGPRGGGAVDPSGGPGDVGPSVPGHMASGTEEEPGSTLTSAPANGTMSGSTEASEVPADGDPGVGEDAHGESGVVTGPAWPAAYARIVARWVERRRAQEDPE